MARGTHADPRRELFLALSAVEAAEATLRERMRRYRAALRRSQRYFEGGGRASALRDAGRIEESRDPVAEAIRALEAARARSRDALYRLAASEGMTATEIARTWGVSRQFVSRVLKGNEKVGRPVSRVGS